MKKLLISFASAATAIVAFFLLAIPLFAPVAAQAQTVTISQPPSVTVNGRTVALTYNSARQESALTATFNFSVSGGSQGVNILEGAPAIGFFDQNGNNANVNTSGITLTPTTSVVGTTADSYGQLMYVIPAGQTVNFTASATINPQQLFAGTYHATLVALAANATTNIGNEYELQVPANQTNTRTIVGEIAPYISSVSPNPATVGQTMTVTGQRLNSSNAVVNVYIDGQVVTSGFIVTNNTTLTFMVPSLSSGVSHTLQIKNSTTGASNLVAFQVTGGTSGNLPPVISGLTAPTTLSVNQTGTWTINASDPQNGSLSYSVNWGDTVVTPNAATSNFVQTTTFTHSYASAGIYTVTFTVTDSAGLTAQTTSTINIGNSSKGGASANISLDAASPLTSTIAVTNITNSTYLGLPVLVFDVSAQGGSLTLNSLDASFTTSGTSTGILGAAYLYEGSTLVASAAISNVPGAVANFGKFAPITIPAGSQLPLTIKVDVSNVGNGGFTVSSNINPIAVGLVDSNGNSVVPSGSAQGNVITVVGAGPAVSIAGTPTIMPTAIANGGSTNPTTLFTAVFDVNVTAVGESVTLGLPSNAYPAFGGFSTPSTIIEMFANGVPVSVGSANGIVASYSVPTGATLSNNGTSFIIAQNQTVTIPVTYVFNMQNVGANSFGLKLLGMNYSVGTTQGFVPISNACTPNANCSSSPSSGGGSGSNPVPTCPAGWTCTPITTPTQPTNPTQPIQSSNASVTAYLQSANSDHAGTWNVFGPGPSNLGGSANDFNWNVTLNLSSSETIQSMQLISSNGLEGWSTVSSTNNPLGKELYPLVVFNESKGGGQVNTAYGQTLGSFGVGTVEFYLYGQPEVTTFTGGTLTINFTDGTSVTAQVPASNITVSPTSLIPTTTVCPVGYICSPGSPTAVTCPAGYTCTVVTANCPAGYTCQTATVPQVSLNISGISGGTTAGLPMTIYGSSFVSGDVVNFISTFGGVKQLNGVIPNSVSSNQISLYVPSLTSGTYYVHVSNGNASSNVVTFTITSNTSIQSPVVSSPITTVSSTPTPTPTPTVTPTPTPTPTPSPSSTVTSSPTPTPSNSPAAVSTSPATTQPASVWQSFLNLLGF